MGLVVTRKPGEALQIGDPNGELTIVRVLGSNERGIRLMVDAPLHLAVHREEVGERIRRGETTPAQGGFGRFDLIAFAKRQQSWSQQTFGPGPLTASLLDHMPKDSADWADLVLLALDGLLRCTGSAELAAKAVKDKADLNVRSAWPDWRTADRTKAIGHIAEPEASIESAAV